MTLEQIEAVLNEETDEAVADFMLASYGEKVCKAATWFYHKDRPGYSEYDDEITFNEKYWSEHPLWEEMGENLEASEILELFETAAKYVDSPKYQEDRDNLAKLELMAAEIDAAIDRAEKFADKHELYFSFRPGYRGLYVGNQGWSESLC